MANELTVSEWQLTKPVPPELGNKLTPLRVHTVLEGIATGAQIQTACAAAGIVKQTFYRWLEKAEEDPDSCYAEFAELVERARAASELSHVRTIHKAAETQWQAAAWLLERVYPHTYGQRNRTELTGADGGAVEISAMHLIAAIRRDNDQINE